MKEINYGLLGKILSNEATHEERVQFQKWLDESKDNKELYEAFRVFYDTSTIKEVNKYSFSPGLKKEQPIRPKTSRVPWTVAASLIFLLSFSFYFFLEQSNKISDEPIAVSDVISYSIPNGKKSRFLLPDRTVVWLNSDSKIKYIQNPTDSLRQVYLTGEAYFEVARDTLRPFVVNAGDLQATVLGTGFNISNYPENDLVTIALASGKLSVSKEDKNEILLPGNGIKYSKTKHRFDKISIDIDGIAAWKRGILIFEQENFQSVVSRLQRWYDVEITMKGTPSPDWKFTGYFDNEYLSNVLEALCYGKSLTYKIEGNEVRINTK